MARSMTSESTSGGTPFAAFVTLRGNRRRQRWFTGFSLLGMLTWSMLAGEDFRGSAVTVVLLLAGLVTFVVVFIRRVPARRGDGANPVARSGWSMMAFVLFATAVACLAIVSISIGWVWLVLPAYAVTDLVLSGSSVRWRVLTPAAVVVGTAAGVAVMFNGETQDALTGLVVGFVTAVVVLGIAGSEAMELRLWRSTVALEQARQDADSVATMRERLRLAEDLHDILGHAMEGVALKSELAARLSATEPDRAGREMVEVQQLARQTMRDVRDVVHRGSRTDLVVELAGVRDLLSSAGISCEVHGDPRALDMTTRELFGRVVREAVTNALRHAELTRCDITINTDRGTAEVRVRNDGVGKADTVGSRSGLDGLRRRLGDAGGELTAETGPEPGTFTVRATVPVATSQHDNR
jgi:two-component system, NarL family, sensor histidine kinase DesK